jgi:hypothetical protein
VTGIFQKGNRIDPEEWLKTLVQDEITEIVNKTAKA